MPTDEQQLREQFEAFVYRQTVNRDYSSPWPTPTELAWLAWLARDAEVQALRELVDHAKRIFQNAEVRSGYCVCGETPERHDNSADCPYTDRGQWESDLWLKREAAVARAALAGGEEGGEDDD